MNWHELDDSPTPHTFCNLVPVHKWSQCHSKWRKGHCEYCQEVPSNAIAKVESYHVWPVILMATGPCIPQIVCLRRVWWHAEVGVGTLCGLGTFWAPVSSSPKWRSWDGICKAFSSEPGMQWTLNTRLLNTSLMISSLLCKKNSVVKGNSRCQEQQMESLRDM